MLGTVEVRVLKGEELEIGLIAAVTGPAISIHDCLLLTQFAEGISPSLHFKTTCLRTPAAVVSAAIGSDAPWL